MKYWEIIADRLSKAGWSLGWVSAVDSQAGTIWIADAHRVVSPASWKDFQSRNCYGSRKSPRCSRIAK
jgi:hypothetical protein